jgi:hypothetical protein
MNHVSKFSCTYCDKGYTRKLSHDRHVILCEILHQSPRLEQCDSEESTDIPTVLQLYKIIQELAAKQKYTEQKMAEMQKWIQKTKKKLNIIEWLNSNCIPNIGWKEWTQDIIVLEEHIDILINENMIQTVFEIIKTKIGEKNTPIYCFTQKVNLYYYEENEWKILLPEDFIVMIKWIHYKILKALTEWNVKYSEKSEKMQLVYNKTIIKLMGADFTKDSLFLKSVRVELYNYLKINIKDVIEYEFEF